MKRARDVRDQLEGLMERVEIELTSNPNDNTAIRKVVSRLLREYVFVCLFVFFCLEMISCVIWDQNSCTGLAMHRKSCP